MSSSLNLPFDEPPIDHTPLERAPFEQAPSSDAQLVERDGKLVLGLVGNRVRDLLGGQWRQLEEPAQHSLAGDTAGTTGHCAVVARLESPASGAGFVLIRNGVLFTILNTRAENRYSCRAASRETARTTGRS